MANMSYCRFRNTLSDLRDCQDAIGNEDKLCNEESRARDELIRLCAEILLDLDVDVDEDEVESAIKNHEDRCVEDDEDEDE
jgi:hypothetical protein